MWDHILNGLIANFMPSHLLTVFIGAIAGLVIGALPGLSAVSGVALMLPFTFGMDPAQGVIMLASVYMSAEYGGSISAILLNTPGTSGAACTTIDGTPMTKRGEAQEALYLSLLASAFGGLVGALALLFLTGPLAKASLLLGPGDIFWVAIAGLSLVAGLASGNLVKGLIGVVLGIAMTLVGQDLVTGEMRYVLDYRFVGGISVVPALLGLFTVATILALLEAPDTAVAPLNIRNGVFKTVLRRMSKMKILMIWSSVVGTIVGVVPGAGASVSAFLAYGEAKRISKNRAEFGKGAWEGVVAPEASNNAVVGGSLVPLLALGIPGSGSAAIMFGALAVHGIIPGPRLFVERADLAYTFIIGLFFTVVAMTIIGLLTIRWSSLVVKVPGIFMIPGILVLSLIGAYGIQNSVVDVYILVAVGLVAYFLSKLDVPAVTVALGFVLGRLMEESFQQTVLLAEIRNEGSLTAYFLSSWVTIVLIAITLLVVVTGLMQFRAESKAKLAAGEDDISVDGPMDGITMRSGNVILAAVTIVGALLLMWGAADFASKSAFFPNILSGLLIVLSLVLAAVSFKSGPNTRMARTYPFAGVPWFNLLVAMLALILCTASLTHLGFYESSFLFASGVTWFLTARGKNGNGVRAAMVSVTYGALLTLVVYVLFKLVLGVVTAPGIIVP